MLASIFSLNVLQTALELGCIYGLVALALFLSYSILNIADLSTDGCFTLGCAVACQVALTGHPILALAAAMAAGVCSGFVTAFLQTRLGVESIKGLLREERHQGGGKERHPHRRGTNGCRGPGSRRGQGRVHSHR